MTNFIIENWFLIIIAIAVIIGIVGFIINFIQLPTKQKIKSLKSWLLMAVTTAESVYGSKTGKIKLGYVYDMFVQRFPGLKVWISFEKFQQLVDEALDRMKEMLKANPDLEERLFAPDIPEEVDLYLTE